MAVEKHKIVFTYLICYANVTAVCVTTTDLDCRCCIRKKVRLERIWLYRNGLVCLQPKI